MRKVLPIILGVLMIFMVTSISSPVEKQELNKGDVVLAAEQLSAVQSIDQSATLLQEARCADQGTSLEQSIVNMNDNQIEQTRTRATKKATAGKYSYQPVKREFNPPENFIAQNGTLYSLNC